MPIFYSLVARGQTILCDAAREHGNFRLVAQKIIAKIPQYDAKMSYVYEKYGFLFLHHSKQFSHSYTFHYSVANSTIFMVLTDDHFDRRVAFSFLMDTQQLFQSRYGVNTEQISAYQFRDFIPELNKLMVSDRSNSQLTSLISPPSFQ